MRIAVISNGEVCLPILQFLKQHGFTVLFFSDIQEPGERAATETFCQSFHIPLQYRVDETSLHNWLTTAHPAVVFVCGFNHRINVDSLPHSISQHMFNIHPGLLPAYRGPSPVFWQLKDSTKEVGVCIHRVAQQFDAGAVVWEKRIPRESHFTYTQLMRLTNYFALEGVAMIMQQLLTKQPLHERLQDKTKAVYHKRATLSDVTIQWQTMHADEIVRLINACNSWNKGAITQLNGAPCKIVDAYKLKIKAGPGLAPGTISQLKDELWVACTSGEMLNVTMINLDGNFVPARLLEKYGYRKGNQFG